MTVIIKPIINGFVVGMENEKEGFDEIYAQDVSMLVTIIRDIFTPEQKATEVKEPPKMMPDAPKPPADYAAKKATWSRPKEESM